MINYIKSLFGKKDKKVWIRAKLGSIIYENNPYEFGFCPISIYKSSPSIPTLPSVIEWDNDMERFVTGELAYEICKKRKLEREERDLKEIEVFIKTNISFFPEKIVNQYVNSKESQFKKELFK